MTHEAFCILVDKMRKTQIKYFKDKNKSVLYECFKLEKEVDKYLESYLKPIHKYNDNLQEMQFDNGNS